LPVTYHVKGSVLKSAPKFLYKEGKI
jgi:hypothetical protein